MGPENTSSQVLDEVSCKERKRESECMMLKIIIIKEMLLLIIKKPVYDMHDHRRRQLKWDGEQEN